MTRPPLWLRAAVAAWWLPVRVTAALREVRWRRDRRSAQSGRR